MGVGDRTPAHLPTDNGSIDRLTLFEHRTRRGFRLCVEGEMQPFQPHRLPRTIFEHRTLSDHGAPGGWTTLCGHRTVGEYRTLNGCDRGLLSMSGRGTLYEYSIYNGYRTLYGWCN